MASSITKKTYTPPLPKKKEQIVNVWADNFFEELSNLTSLLDQYTCLTIDTEFPGFPFSAPIEGSEYSMIKENVDHLKLIQLGITLATKSGAYPSGTCTWQFNFSFDLEKDMYAQNAVQLLKASGIDFSALKTKGIDQNVFAEHLFTSGLVLNPELMWITYRGTFDLGYILKIADGERLPATEQGFLEKLQTYFPHFYDIKCMLKDIAELPPGTLNSIASVLNIPRTGMQHQAGSDSLVTSKMFFALQERYLHHYLGPEYHNALYGLSSESDLYINEYNTTSPGIMPMHSGYYYGEEYEYSGGSHPYYPGLSEIHQAYSEGYYSGDGVLEYM